VSAGGYSLGTVHGANLIQPQFPDDDGSADPRLADALAGYSVGRVGEHTVLEELYDSRLLVPVVALLSSEEQVGELRREKESEMALPVLIGGDGRRGVLAFSSAEALARWRPDARPVAVTARQACQATLSEQAHALVVDVAGPVPFAVEGLRLQLLAEGTPIPPPHQDPEVLAAIEAAFTSETEVSGVQVTKGGSAELSVRFAIAAGQDERATVQRVADRLAELLRGRIVGGVEIGVIRR
jgi:SseB protein N-terminal domain